MRDLITELTQTVDLVLLDTPPILAATDPLVVAPNVSGVVLICRANRTRRDALRRAAEALQQGGIRIVGAVLNQNASREGNYYYYEGYYGPRGPAEPDEPPRTELQQKPVDAG
jgi:Mrp family chromosome partitioning ATPase